MDPGKCAHVVEQHSLEVILGNARRPRRAEQRALLLGRVAHLDRLAVRCLRQGGAHEQMPLDIVATPTNLVLEVPGPQQFHGAQADDRRSGMGPRFRAPIDEQAFDAVASECDAADKSGRASTDDHDGKEVGRAARSARGQREGVSRASGTGVGGIGGGGVGGQRSPPSREPSR